MLCLPLSRMKLTGVQTAAQGENLAGQGHFGVLPFSLVSNGLHAGGGRGHGGTTVKGYLGNSSLLACCVLAVGRWVEGSVCRYVPSERCLLV